MHLSTLLPPLLLTLITFSLAATDYQNAIACSRRNPSINTAIDAFCNKKNAQGQLTNDILVPSPYSNAGASHGGVKVSIPGKCDPPQWVPFEWCAPQFHAMCAGMGRATGSVVKIYGRIGCQAFTIEEGEEIGS